jgi:diaminohydroxyphosphoribosylaminopyrimidine deaminase/5-amino-6-(5-phosphoribosylamino)uracil reductase
MSGPHTSGREMSGSSEQRLSGDQEIMRRAMALAEAVRDTTSPNPWVGCVLVAADGTAFEGATSPPGGPHAEAAALTAAGPKARGAVLYCTLEPCSVQGRTPPCADAVVAARVSRVVVALEDPDPRMRGRGLAMLKDAGVEVDIGVCAEEVRAQLLPYIKHRTTGRPWVVLKLAATLDGRTAAPDGVSRWITSEEARKDAHRLRASSDAVLVGAGTVRADDPSLTVRWVEGRDPKRVVLGKLPERAIAAPAQEMSGDLGEILDELGRQGVVQLLVEGGASVARDFHRAGLVDRYVLYLAPALFGGDDARGLFAGPGSPSMAALWRGRVLDVARVGPDIRVEIGPQHEEF